MLIDIIKVIIEISQIKSESNKKYKEIDLTAYNSLNSNKYK